mmetsp:Transcript_18839/g.35329  ORF Transcript_18839/g.35329 Transcript_18839/m.35329 type:complete len:271 (+) Transcript_18839:72-884(+)
MRFGQRTATQIIESVAKNETGLETLDLTKNASFQMKALENTRSLAEALKKNTIIRTLILRECEISDSGAEALGAALAVNTGIEDLDLQQNHLSTGGAISIAKGLASNSSVKTLNLMNQNHKISEEAMEKFISMFETNVTLTKLMWKVDSRRTWELSKLITRNVEIGRRQASGASVQDLLPPKLKQGKSENTDVDSKPAEQLKAPEPEPANASVPEPEPKGGYLPASVPEARAAELTPTPATEPPPASSEETGAAPEPSPEEGTPDPGPGD